MRMDTESLNAPAPVLDSPSAGLEDVRFPDESALGEAIREAQASAARRAERLDLAVQGAVAAWLKEQGVDPAHPPEHWGR